MIVSDSIALVDGSRYSENFASPRYDSYCFSRIPGTLVQLLSGQTPYPVLPEPITSQLQKKYRKIIFAFVDAFGWRFFERFRDTNPLLKTISDQGIVAKLTSQFPSTTAAHVTCFNTGLSPSQSGIYEWFIYEPSVDAIISPLPFSFQRSHGRETLLAAGINATDIFPTATIHQNLRGCGIKSYVYADQKFTPSSYSNVVYSGAEISPFRDYRHGIHQLIDHFNGSPESSFHYLYIDRFDSLMHEFGPCSNEADNVLSEILISFENILLPQLQRERSDSLLVIAADHGMMEIDPQTTVYVDRAVPELQRLILRNAEGIELAPAGSSRDLFLHVEKAAVSEALDLIRGGIGDRATVLPTQSLIDEGFFGPLPASETFKKRIADIVILPHDRQSVWWSSNGRFQNVFYGQHGGLSPQELHIPFLALEI